ncbi:cytochrome P450 [Salinirubellus salinus]|uniref:Cytochrome P450 n=1 Tax=Salinirubellus salinus TaxID=1364945 RepID=A0A9E7R6E2_9EURY|nr:cytochrome P450 [Salinirubellus salinus]UWM56751.1 cytochrome P450 [Salinirubellus salinus]
MSSDTGEYADRTLEAVAEAGSSPTEDVDVSALPLPPYPPNLGSPKLHVLRQMRDPRRFMFESMATRDVVRTHFVGMGDIYNLAHPEHSKRILLTERDRFSKTDDFSIAFGEGLLTVEGEEWRQQRDVLQPLFVRESVRGYGDGMVEQIRRRSDRWADGQRIDLQREMTHMTLDVLFATVLGRELELDGDEAIREASERLHDWFLPTSWFLPNWVPTPARRRFTEAKRTLEREATRLLEEKTAEGAPTDPSEATDLLSLLVGLRQAGVTDSGMLTDERLRDQMVTMIFAGHDTTTTTLSFAFYLLAHHPEVRERFHAEVDTLDGPPTMADVDDLEVTERVVTETLRLFPPVHTLPRLADEDVAFDGYRVPAGGRISIPIFRIQRDPRFFEAPDEFRPERWTPEFRQSLHNFAYAPFGGGPRICIGREFALLEAKLALATVGRQYELYHLGDDDDEPTSFEMTTRMRAGEQFLVTER